MRMAVSLADENLKQGGGPFGAVVVYNGEVIGQGANRVTADSDPTAHAEMLAIRSAARKRENFDLSDCTLYTSCEPCPMCLGAVYWARIPILYYGNTREQAAGIGFNDAFIYREFAVPIAERSVAMHMLLPSVAITTFEQWTAKADKKAY